MNNYAFYLFICLLYSIYGNYSHSKYRNIVKYVSAITHVDALLLLLPVDLLEILLLVSLHHKVDENLIEFTSIYNVRPVSYTHLTLPTIYSV